MPLPSPFFRVRLRTLLFAALATTLAPLAAAAASADDVVRYKTVFEGAPAGVTKRSLEGVSRLHDLEKAGAQSRSALERRARADHPRIRELLESEGYYDALVDHRIDATDERVVVTVEIDAGERYTIAPCKVHLTAPTGAGGELDASIAAFEALDGKTARATSVLEGEVELLDAIAAKGFPLVTVTKRSYVADHGARTLAVALNVESGAQARFGNVDVVGLEQVHGEYVRNRLPWKDGELYDPAAVEKGRRELGITGLFSHVSIRHADATDADGLLPVTVTVSEAKFRTFGVGVRYDSSLGAGGGLSWEHRNVRGEGEKLRIAGEVAQAGWAAGFSWREPDFVRPGYTLEYQAGYQEEETNAYEVKRAATLVILEVPLSLVLTTRVGAKLEYTPVKSEALDPVTDEPEQDETFVLVGLPLALTRNTTDDILEPTRGTRADLTVTPYKEISGDSLAFVVARITPSIYLPFEIPRFGRSVLAGRMSLGSISGAKRDETPADKRFYAGGGGSIRGYDYQSVGPIDDDDDPLGGRSLLEAGVELRLKLTRSFGLVGFFEGGNVYTSVYPDLDDVIRWGAGGGIRYYSPVGPFRVDVATPVNGRDGVDDPVQVYISLGEAF